MNEWHSWIGGDNPVPKWVVVVVRFRHAPGGEHAVSKPRQSDMFVWTWSKDAKSGGDIVGYRLATEAEIIASCKSKLKRSRGLTGLAER